MRVGVVSGFACSLSWWMRLAAEGCQVKVWIKPSEAKTVGDGLVSKAGTYDELIGWLRLGLYSGEPSILLFDASGMGELADTARKTGIPVVGGGRFMDRLEKDREFGFEIARNAGAKLPSYKDFESFDSCLDFAHGLRDEPVFFKSDRYLDSDATHGADTTEELVEYLTHLVDKYGSHGKCILQEKIDGVPVSTARWWNGRTWTGPYEYTIEHKKFLAGDLGPSTGCALNAVWFDVRGDSSLAASLGFERLTPLFVQKQAPPGIYDMNSLVAKDGQAYFLEWTPRLGYDSEMTSFRLMPSLSRHLWAVATGGDVPMPSSKLAYGLRIGIPPYPWEKDKTTDSKTCVGDMISGEVGDLHSGSFIAMQLRYKDDILQVASPEGVVGMTYADGYGSIEGLAKKAEEAAKELRPSSLLYRNDGAKVLQDDAKALRKAGFAVHRGLE